MAFERSAKQYGIRFSEIEYKTEEQDGRRLLVAEATVLSI